jgi:hypothetical protein
MRGSTSRERKVRELALHILDLVENSIRAEATVIAVTVTADPEENSLTVAIEDDGAGLRVTPEAAVNPFYTTKRGKKTGLGLSLFKAAAEAAGGQFQLGKSPLGGVLVEGRMQLRHVDRTPLGDLMATLISCVCTNPQVDWRFVLRCDAKSSVLRTSELARQAGLKPDDGLGLARLVSERLKREVTGLQALTDGPGLPTRKGTRHE